MGDWWCTEIIDMKPGEIRYRGYAIEELIGNVGFAEMIWLMNFSPGQSDHIPQLVAIPCPVFL